MTTRLSIETFPNKAAADYIRGKAVADPKNFGALPNQLKQRAFAVAGIEQIDAARRIRDAIAKLPEGASWDEVKKEIAKEVSPYVAGAEARQSEIAGGDAGQPEIGDAGHPKNGNPEIMKAARARAEHTLRIQGFQAYSVARHQQQMAAIEIFPYWKYETVGDNRVRAGHAALDGKVLRADDPWWKTHYPPWDWGCRCIVIALDEEDARKAGISKGADMPRPERSETYSFDPSDAGISLDALTKGRDDDYCRDLFDVARKVTVQRDDVKTETTMWDYMLDRHMKAKGRLLAAQTTGDGKERALVLDFETGKQIGDVAKGNDKGVEIDVPAGKTVATLHTHTNGDNTPSAKDILTGHRLNSAIDYIGAGKRLRRWVWLKKPEWRDEAILESYVAEAENTKEGFDFDAYEVFLDRLIRDGYIKMEELS